MRSQIFLCVVIGGFIQPTFAQSCPAGIPSGGNPLCLPPGASGSPYQQGSPGQAEARQARWEARWGAIAFDPSNAEVGVASGMSSKRKAKDAALANCKERGGNSCKIDLVYYNQCGVVAWGDTYATTASAGTIAQASERGLQLCGQKTSGCQIVYSDCSVPIRVE